jgi:hypothetical protein
MVKGTDMAASKRLKDAIRSAIEQSGGDERLAVEILFEKAKYNQFLDWELKEGAHQILCERLLDEVIADLYYPGRDTFSREESDELLAEVERRMKARRAEREAEDAEHRARFRIVK